MPSVLTPCANVFEVRNRSLKTQGQVLANAQYGNKGREYAGIRVVPRAQH